MLRFTNLKREYNPSGCALGDSPTTNVGGKVDTYFRIKKSGEYDGTLTLDHRLVHGGRRTMKD
jgi:cellulase/cellobiase CelA1